MHSGRQTVYIHVTMDTRIASRCTVLASNRSRRVCSCAHDEKHEGTFNGDTKKYGPEMLLLLKNNYYH